MFFTSGGYQLHAARHASGGSGPPVVMVPGITTPAAAFAFAAERWTRSAAIGDVYVLDMRGRGLSERTPSGTHRAGDYADDVLALIAAAQIDRPLLVGHSLGARVVAAAYARVPGCSRGVVAIDPPMSGPGRRPYPTGLDVFVGGIHDGREGKGVEQARHHYPTWTEEQLVSRGEWIGSCDEVAVVESYSWFHLEAFEPIWAEVPAPALLLYGDASPVVTAPDVMTLQQTNPRAAHHAVAGCGHMVPWDNLDDTTAEIERFLTTTEERAS
ncbi:MAG TPA: alpha/beta hydrolase [Mycobacteriales bacterium]|nr:alpha/beta hydrolase [Mycobacteriales bacterium]